MNQLPKVKINSFKKEEETHFDTLVDIEDYLSEKYRGELDTPYLRDMIAKEAEILIKEKEENEYT